MHGAGGLIVPTRLLFTDQTKESILINAVTVWNRPRLPRLLSHLTTIFVGVFIVAAVRTGSKVLHGRSIKV